MEGVKVRIDDPVDQELTVELVGVHTPSKEPQRPPRPSTPHSSRTLPVTNYTVTSNPPVPASEADDPHTASGSIDDIPAPTKHNQEGHGNLQDQDYNGFLLFNNEKVLVKWSIHSREGTSARVVRMMSVTDKPGNGFAMWMDISQGGIVPVGHDGFCELYH